ncbi:SidA/IucD/PvdA family monooxygenase [Streptomyces sp. SJ1-7]|nr:SidA/IucD/PvdA family monooxygenase [Streptomyces sp. SJ1-7]
MRNAHATHPDDDPVGTTTERPYDLLGIGFGPSNLALAVCAREQKLPLSCLFVERQDTVAWHPGMLIDGARMQISFLKDLVSLRNPSSPTRSSSTPRPRAGWSGS